VPSRGFTLAELLIVIALIVLLVAMAVPAFNFITGSRSVDGAQNQIAAFLGRARSEAIGLQEVRGVFFFLDTRTDRVNMTLVRSVPKPDNTLGDPWLGSELTASRATWTSGSTCSMMQNSSRSPRAWSPGNR
jgi:prepilin-type N-terminal cleavage/methylation domain-containing protein